MSTPSLTYPTLSLALTERLAARVGAARDTVLVVSGAVLIALSALVSIPLPGSPVPITGQTFGVLFVGAALGRWRGPAAAALYVVVGALGAPVYAAHTHGWSVLTGATGGYLVGMVVANSLVGWLAERSWDRKVPLTALAMVAGNVVIYAFGLAWLGHVTAGTLPQVLSWGLWPFLIGDGVKILLATGLLPGAWKLLDRAA